MCDRKNWNSDKGSLTGEINTRNDNLYIEHSSFRHLHENVGTDSTKPFDISLMTGDNGIKNSSNNGNKR